MSFVETQRAASLYCGGIIVVETKILHLYRVPEPLQQLVTPFHEIAQFLTGEDVLREHRQIDHLLHQLRAFCLVLFVEDARGERVVAVDHQVVVVEAAVEALLAGNLLHVLETAHELVLRDHHGQVGLAQRINLRGEQLRINLFFKELFQLLLLVFRQFRDVRIFFFLNEFVNHIGIHAGEAHLLELLLQHVDEVRVEEAGHQQHIVSFLLRVGDIDVLVVGVGSVQHDNISVFVSLQRTHHIAVFFNCKILALSVFQQVEILDFVVEFFVCQGAVFEEDAQVVPFLLELLAVLLEHLLQLLGHLLGCRWRFS